MVRTLMMIGMAVATAASTGCITAAKQAYYGVTGSKGSFYETRVVDPQTLARFDSVRVEPFGNTLGPHVPSSVVSQIEPETARELEKEELFQGQGRELVVRGSVIHFTGQSGLGGSVGSVIGGGDACVCRIQLVDGSTGEMVGEGVCWGEVKSAVRRGSSEYGEGVGKGLTRWLEERLSESGRRNSDDAR